MTNNLANKANDNAVVKLTGNQSISGDKDFSKILLNGTDLDTRLTTDESNISNLQSSVTTLQGKTSAFTYDSSTDTLSISSKVNIAKDLSDVGSIYLGDNIGNDVVYLRGNLNVLGTTNITQTELSRLSGVSSGIQSQLNNRVTTNTTQTVSGLKNFTGGVQLNGSDLNTRITAIETANTNQDTAITDLQNNKQNTLTIDSSVTQNSTNPVTSGGVFTALASYVTSSSLTSTLGSYATTSSLSSYVTSSSLTSTLSSYLTSSTASSTYQTISGMASYFGLSANNTITGINTFNNYQVVERMAEQVHQAGSGGALSLSYTGIKGIIFYAPSANFTLSLTNVPTSNTNCIYTLTFRFSTKFYINAININGSSYTMTAIGGLSNISINSSATSVYQSVQVIFNNSSTPTVTTSVLSVF